MLDLLQLHNNICAQDGAQSSCSLHECPWSPVSMPRMSMLTPVGWAAIFDVSQQIFGSVVCVAHGWKALFNMHQLKRLPVDLDPAWFSKNTDVCGKCTCGLILHKPLCFVIYGSCNLCARYLLKCSSKIYFWLVLQAEVSCYCIGLCSVELVTWWTQYPK